jgi:hypothetical protein
VIITSVPPPLSRLSRCLSMLLCAHRVAASDAETNVDPAPPSSPSSESVLAPIELPWSPQPRKCCTICSPSLSPADDNSSGSMIHTLSTVSGGGNFCVCVSYRRCADADLFETICKIRRDELDGAGSHGRVYHICGEVHLTTRALGPSLVASSSASSFPIGLSGFSRNGISSTLTRSRTLLVYVTPPHLVS